MPPQVQPPIDPRLIVGAIYIVVFVRPHDDGSHVYLLGLYHHTTPTKGKKYHIRNSGSGWIAEHASSANFMKSLLLVGLVRVGYCDPVYASYVDMIVESFPLNKVPPGYGALNCKTWTLHIVGLLIKAGYIRCNDIRGLSCEVSQWAESQFTATSNNVQPRIIVDSRMCTLLDLYGFSSWPGLTVNGIIAVHPLLTYAPTPSPRSLVPQGLASSNPPPIPYRISDPRRARPQIPPLLRLPFPHFLHPFTSFERPHFFVEHTMLNAGLEARYLLPRLIL